MKTALVELISKISSGCMGDDEVARIADEAAQAYADADTFLAANPDIGAPDYADAGMLQYLRAERVVPPYQTRGYKLVELVRVYDAGHAPRS